MCNILVKGDISGIQDFIFNIQSKGAAKALKARSFFIEAITELAEKNILKVFPKAITIYNGGGNFYIKIKETEWDKKKYKSIKESFYKTFLKNNLLISLSYLKCKGDFNENYNNYIQKINRLSGREKLSWIKGAQNKMQFFEPFIDNLKYKSDKDSDKSKGQQLYIDFLGNYIRSNGYIIKKSSNKDIPFIDKNSINLFGYSLQLENETSAGSKKIFRHIPLINNAIVAFEDIANLAKERTGTDKLGVLKLDIDNLGSIFQIIKDEKTNVNLSQKLKFFLERS